MSDSTHARIGPTAHYTAYVWYRLRLPYADLFVTRTGAALYWLFRVTGEWASVFNARVPSMQQYLAHRHRLIDAELRRLAPDRIIELGAGLSRRGTTWAVDLKVPYVELDLPAMIAAKRRRLAQAPEPVRAAAAERLELEVADILDPGFPDRLRALLAGARRPAVIAEGVMGYFSLADRSRFVSAVGHALSRCGAGAFLCDLHTKEDQARVAKAASVLRLAIRTVTRGQGALAAFDDANHVQRFFRETGFGASAALDASDYVGEAPALAETFSPASVYRASVGHPGPDPDLSQT